MRLRFISGISQLILTLALTTPLARAALLGDLQPPPFVKDSTDGNIAAIVGEKLQTWQYSHHPFDQEMSGKFLDRYLDTLDYSHVYFLQSDINEFDRYRTNLNVLTLQDHDLSPCWTIFARFMQRANERIQYQTNLLATLKFDFSGHDRFVVNRHSLPYAKDLNEAKEFWRQDLRSAYLDELLNAKDVEFTGPVSSQGKKKITISLIEDKTQTVDFDLLPKTFFGKKGRAIGSATVSANGSNATIHLELAGVGTLKKSTNTLFSAGGAKIGEIHIHHPWVPPVATVVITNAASTNASLPLSTNSTVSTPPGANHLEASSNSYVATIHLDQKNFRGIYKSLTNHYAVMLDNYKKLDNDRVFETYVNSMARAYDPHSDYMGHSTAENFNIQMKLSLVGIGAILETDGPYCKIRELKEGPAKRSGKIKVRDRIVAVAQTNGESVNVIDMPVEKIVDLIRGPKGTPVELTLIPADAPDSTREKVTLIRDEIKLEEQFAKARLYEEPRTNQPALKLGVIDLASFYGDPSDPTKNTTAHVTRLIQKMMQANVDGIILDLRRNGGGYLEEAIKLTGLFIPHAAVVQTKDPNGEIVTDPSPEPTPLYDGPFIVLTSVLSASASEIVAGAWQDHGRALIVGDHSTFGKGTVQTPISLAALFEQKHLDASFDPGSLKLTIKKFYRAGGVSTQLQGVISDIELPSLWNAADVGERSLPNALPCDSVPSDDLLNLNRVKPYLAQLQAQSRKRVDHDKDFAYMRQDIAEYEKQQADKSVSLNKEERLAEQKRITARDEARKKERLSRPKSQEKIYEITIKNVDLPDLQPLEEKTNSVASAKAPVSEDDLDADENDAGKEALAEIDPTLEETKRILADYIALIKAQAPVASRISAAP
ncbi:MAG TPA: carboxy terminal-processing peptidase [Candidatus Saccharimonadales bacterium]|nr:carboxy terminal-processing peptidase [Candidatus Saccharimonadales bacterium]